MKKILFLLSLFMNLVSFSQVSVLTYVTDIASFSNANDSAIIVRDTIRGGTFSLYSGANPADGGIIFTDAIGRKWIRQNIDAVNINWFGAQTGGPDNRAIILAAMTSSKAVTGRIKIYIPESPTDVYYYVSDSIVINDKIELFGDSYQSKLLFASHKSGIIFSYPSSQYSYIHDILIHSNTTGSGFDSSKHGIIARTPLRFDNVLVRYFDGCGFYAVNSYPNGNSNTTSFYKCVAFGNRLHGFYFRGGDANAMVVTNCDATVNGGVGYYDKSFLGNHFSNNHAASNGSPELPYQRGLVKSGGAVYACIKDTTVGQAPPNSTYWQNVGTDWIGYPYVLDYNNSTVYYTVAGYVLEGVNQYGTLLGNYCELDQAPGYIDIRNIDFGSNIPTRNISTTLYGSLGVIRAKSFFASDVGITSTWLYGGNMGSYFNPYSSYPTYSGFFTGGYQNSGMVDFWDNNNRIGSHYTSASALNILTQANKNLLIYTNANTTTPKLFVGASTVGINKSTADSTLDINGSLKVSGYANLLNDIKIHDVHIGLGGGSISANTRVGNDALAANISGNNNSAFGSLALSYNTTGGYNSAFGRNALGSNTTGAYNSAFGTSALFNTQTGNDNTAMGLEALLYNTSGSYNVGLGNYALLANTTGSFNTAVGRRAGQDKTTGDNNTLIGYYAGKNLTSGSGNTIIGVNLDIGNVSNHIALGDGNGNVRLLIDNNGNAGIGTTSPSTSALLDISSTSKGFLPPRMTAGQASAISSPAEGLIVYVTNTNSTFTSKGWWGYNGSAWEKLNN